MSNDKIVQPDSLRNPAEQASINAMISAAVKDVFASMGPLLQSIALTPEKLREANKPYINPAVTARETRERAMMREDPADAERKKAELQKQCSHRDANGNYSISVIHNYPDRQPRLVCLHCHLFLQPKHWEILAPNKEYPRGVPKLAEAHPEYQRILADVNQRLQSV